MKYIYYISILLTLVLAGCSGVAAPEQSKADTETFEPEAHPDDGVRTLRLYFEEHDLEYLYERDPESDVRVDAHAKLDDSEEIL
ncbi:hypothetical protein R0K17_20700, partial [Planococcus sp. SIMBA_143]